MSITFKWECPKCGAPANEHGSGGSKYCAHDPCSGLLCECFGDEESEKPDHGTSLSNPCTQASCYHCGWGGTLPIVPMGIQPWEKKALAAGWTPPKARKKELKL